MISKTLHQKVIPVVVVWILLSMPLASASTPGQDAPLLEIVFSCCHTDYDQSTTRVYSDGRYVSESVFRERVKSGRMRSVSQKEEKQLEMEELAELVNWAGQFGQGGVKSEYVVTEVRENPDWATITYRSKGGVKVVKVYNFSRGDQAQKAKVPAAVVQLMRWARPYTYDKG